MYTNDDKFFAAFSMAAAQNVITSKYLILVKYRDIGVTLIKKGFNFKIPINKMGGIIVANEYADAYLRQCRKRVVYLHHLAKARKK